MKKLRITTIIFLVLCTSTLVEAKAGADEKSNLEVLDIKMEPIRQGQNVVIAKVRNTSNEDQAFDIDIQTESFTGNWQTHFPHTIKGSEIKWIRHGYKISSAIAADPRIRIRFYTAGPVIGANGQETKHYFKTVEYYAGDLEHARSDDSESEPASQGQRGTITETLRQFQNCVRNKDYEAAWQFFSQDFIDAEFLRQPRHFQKSMETPYSGFPLSRTEVLALEPKSAGRRKGILALTTALKDERWTVNFVKVSDKWRIDSFDRIDATPIKKVPLEPGVQEQAVRKAFEQWQNSTRDGKYETAWGLLANDLRRSRQLENDFQRFTKQWDSDEPMKTLFLNLRPESVTSMKMGESAILNASHSGQPWRILYIMEDGQWKLRIMKRGQQNGGDWQARLLPKMRKQTTKHFDIFCFKDSTAENDIEEIAEQRDRGFREICRFLGKNSDVRIRMILFEDAATKYSHTGHEGAGWATGNMVVEIYNEKQKLDPYHETAHILMRSYGSPPALFNEGFATYISERLGSHALDAMGGGESSVHERVRELDGKGKLIPLEELLTYTEIGSGKSNPPVAYPEAASFVKFLIETYGKERFLKAYGTLRNSNDKTTQQQNVKSLENIYGKSLDELKIKWKNTLLESK